MSKLKLYGLFVGLSITIMLLCDTLAFKVIRINGYDFAASGLIYSFSFFLASIATEVYGYNLAGRIIWIQLLSHVTFIMVITLLIRLPSPPTSVKHPIYFDLYHDLWRVLIGSCIAIPFAYFVNDFIISKMKIYMYGKVFILRFLSSSIIGNAILVAISYPVTFYSLYSVNHIVIIAANTLVYKVSIAILLLPLGVWLSGIIKRVEKLDYYDYGTSYNPITVFENSATGENKYATSK